MTKRIFRYMSLLILLTILFFAVLGGFAFSGTFGAEVKDGLKTLRVSIINESGEVIFDNVADPGTLENHLDRPEVVGAIQNGTGESERFSDTLGETTYYYAVRLADGNILRLALTTDNATGLLYRFISVILICLVLAAFFAFLIAQRLTKRIIAPINNIDLDADEPDGYDELVPFFWKIETQKRELTAQLAEIETRNTTITAIMENMREGLLLLNENGLVMLANESVLEILGVSEAVGRNMVSVCRDVTFLETAKKCLAGEKSETVMGFRDRIYNVLFNPVLDGDAIHGGVVLFIDITERYAAEAQRKEFSANVSHELQTPLTTIVALSEMIADGTAKDKDLQPFADKISSQSLRLINIIDDIIKLSEFDEDAVPKEFTRFHLYDVADAVIRGLHEKAAAQNITVELKGDSQLFIEANMRMIDELLYNLVDNAIKYNRIGGDVTVSLSAKDDRVRIEVKDSGIGISQEHISRIFERFYRVDKSRSKKTGGTGLGLSIVKHIAEFHGGQVEVESKMGVGTNFICTFEQSHEE
ncbi:MAG: PAS domain S-box protein [Clostridiales Family XIII bacterium]|nr:PAS domain S-box protein [Clostridiales Family XIII bacterium]